MKQTILGASGPIGIELAKSLQAYTSDIRLVSRNPKRINPTDELMALDLTQKENVLKAIEGSDITYVTIGFPYQAKVWRENWVPFIRNVIEGCLTYHSKLVYFDNVYSIGGDHVNHITETSPISPISKKGEVKAEVDKIILESIEKDHLQAIIARAPDFFGGTSRQGSTLMNLVYDNLVKGKKAQWLCNANAIHTMGFVPDLTKGTAMLGNTPEAYNQIWNLPTDPQKIIGKEWIHLFATVMGTKDSYTVFSNWMIKILGVFVPLLRELSEMNYQFDRDYYFDSTKFNTYFHFTPTPNAEAVRQAVEQLQGMDSQKDTEQ